MSEREGALSYGVASVFSLASGIQPIADSVNELLTSPIVFPLLIVVSGLFLGSRVAIAVAAAFGLLYPIANAGDATPGGGKVAVCVRVLPRGAAAVLGSTGDAPRQVFIEVRDQGTGVPPELQASIFEPFVTTKPRGQGTGLGLATVRSIAAGSGGWVALQCAPSGGSSFRVFLPEAPAAGGHSP